MINPRRLAPIQSSPSHQISLRSSPVGGAITNAHVQPDNVVRDATVLTLLIHGFANDLETARISFARFREQFGDALNRETVDVFWPGDMATPSALHNGQRGYVSAALSVIAYPMQISRAQDSAIFLMRRLHTDLNDRLNIAASAGRVVTKLRLRIVAHSLGCLLALELLKALEARLGSDLEIDLVVLMAAAVPRFRLRSPDLGGALSLAKNVRVYYSLNDKILMAAFPAGQVLYRPFPHGWSGPRRVAIGRHGCGDYLLPNTVERQGTHDHGDYWTDRALAKQVGQAHSPPSALRPLGATAPQPANRRREIPSGRFVAGRPPPDGRQLR